jgi:proteasome accessory factor C
VADVLTRFGYTEAELTRDLNSVFVCGLPGYGPGDLMEAYIDDDEVVIDSASYFMRAPRLSPTEALGLLASGLAIAGSGQGTPALDSAIAKLTRVVVPDADESLAIDLADTSAELTMLRDAARDNRTVRITYRSLSREEESERVIEPWIVFTTLGNWYVLGHCRLVDDSRTFRIDRIKDLEVLGENFEPPDQVPTPGVGYTPSDGDISAVIDLSPRARWVLEYYPVEIVQGEGDSTRIRFSAPDPELPARLLLRLGATARLVEGAETAARVREIGRSLSARYRTGR